MPSYISDKYAGIVTLRMTYKHGLGDLHTDVLILKEGDVILAEIETDFPKDGIAVVNDKTINLASYKLIAKYSDGTSNNAINDWVYTDGSGIINTPGTYLTPSSSTSIVISSATAGGSITIPAAISDATHAISIAPNSLTNPNPLVPNEYYNIQFKVPTKGNLTNVVVKLKDTLNNTYTIPSDKVTVNDENDISFLIPQSNISELDTTSPYEIIVTPTYHHEGDSSELTATNVDLSIPNVPYVDNPNSSDELPVITGITPNGKATGKNFKSGTIVIARNSNGSFTTASSSTTNGNNLNINLPSDSGVTGYASNPTSSASGNRAWFSYVEGVPTLNVNLNEVTTSYPQSSIPSNANLSKVYPLQDAISLPPSKSVTTSTPEAIMNGYINSNKELIISSNNLIDLLSKYGVILNLKRDVLSDLENETVNTESIPLTKHTGRYVFQTKGKDSNQNVKKSKPIHFLTPPRTIKGLEVLNSELTSTSCIIRWAAEGQNLKFIKDIKIYQKLQSENDTAYTLISTTTSKTLIEAGKHRKISISGLTSATAYTFKIVITNNTGSISDTINVTTI